MESTTCRAPPPLGRERASSWRNKAIGNLAKQSHREASCRGDFARTISGRKRPGIERPHFAGADGIVGVARACIMEGSWILGRPKRQSRF